jgi:Tol biopolymer transport system component
MRRPAKPSSLILITAALFACSVNEPTMPPMHVPLGAAITAVTTPTNSIITFVSDQDGDADIYSVRSDGTGLVNLTNNTIADGNIAWSPDGRMIAFGSDLGDHADFEVMTMLPDGTRATRLTAKGADDKPFGWSPVGVPVIAYVRYNGPGDIYGITPDGLTLSYLAITPQDENYPKWSPDGAQIAYVVEETQIFIVNRDGTGTHLLQTGGGAGAGGQFAWSRDGSRIAFLKEGNAALGISSDIFVINVDGKGLHNITNSRETETAFEWSPDGSRILFERLSGTIQDVWIMNSDGTAQTNLTARGPGSSVSNATWSPDGTKIALVHTDASGNTVLVWNADGSPPRIQVSRGNAHYSDLHWVTTPEQPGSTPSGSDVPVSPIDETTGAESPIDLVFQTVTGSGTTTVTSGTVGGGGGPPPPSNFRLGSPPTYYDIQTTASYSGSIRICLTYTGVSYGNESNLKLLHQEIQANGSAQWVDRTASLDTQNDVICGTVSSLSPFLVAEENFAPVVSRISLPTAPIALGAIASLTADFSDANYSDSHTSTIDWEGATSVASITENAGIGSVSGAHTYAGAGVYTVAVSVSDGELSGSRSSAADAPAYIVVYDPSTGFVTGGGWITSPSGACEFTSACADATGKANFGFVARYKKGATVPSGDTEFQFSAGNLKFQSTRYEWLVVAGSRAKYKGDGQINGAGSYKFLLTAIDGNLTGGGVDQFRIKITDQSTGLVVYDNKRGEPEDSDAATSLGGGSIVIHK